MTTDAAWKFYRMKAVPNERHLNQNRIRRLRKKITEHGALPFRWGRAEVEETGEVFRVNGQHTSTMLVKDSAMITDKMVVTIEDYLCETMKDLADLYSQIDSSESSRSAGDVNLSHAAVTDGLGNCNRRVINLCVTALSHEKWGDQYTRQPKEDRAALLDTAPEFVLFVDKLKKDITHEDWRVVGRGPVVMAILATWRKSRRAASEFWRLVARCDGPDAKSADRTLGKYLQRTGITTGRPKAARGIGRVEGPVVMYSRCVTAWNAWRQGKTTKLRVYEDKEPPKAC
jgi:hypothetical protein